MLSSASHPDVDVQIATSDENIPSDEDFRSWVAAALPPDRLASEITIRVVGRDESQALNAQYRQQDKPTNVLSFPTDLPPELQIPLLGDLVVCAGVVEHEAHEQGKSLAAHWAHMVVHGTLHLLGYDHESDEEAEEMEALEIRILGQLGFPAPYESP
ncbi:MAG: rRNA maturation RNase YbeY [Cellvibrionaceae bacterium]|nr:rRNA maturation RNase YbeY [Cellvibrionaceae bacterium]